MLCGGRCARGLDDVVSERKISSYVMSEGNRRSTLDRRDANDGSGPPWRSNALEFANRTRGSTNVFAQLGYPDVAAPGEAEGLPSAKQIGKEAADGRVV